MKVKLVNFPPEWTARFGDIREVPDETEVLELMLEEHNLPGNEGTEDGETINFVSREIPIVKGVVDWEMMRESG